MPDQIHRTRVVAIIDPGSTEQQISAALSEQADFQLLDLITDLHKAPQVIRGLQPETVLVDYTVAGQPTIDTLDDLALQFPEVALVAILPDGDLQRTQQAMLAGARGFIVLPFTQVNLLSTLRRVRDLEQRRRRAHVDTAAHAGAETQPLRVITLFGPRGGVGTSTLAANLAIALAEATNERVLLMEGKLIFGHLGLLLNLRTRNTIAELLPHAHALDENLVREVVAEHVSGIHVLLAPAALEVAQGIRPEPLFNVVDGLRQVFTYIVIDAGAALNDNTVTLLDLADRVLLVTAPDLAALHDASRFIQITRTLAYPPGKVLTVLNRAGQLGSVRVKDIQAALHHELFAQIPDDTANALRSLNRGVPLLFKYPRSPASRGIQRLARHLLEPVASPPVLASSKIVSSNGRRALLPRRMRKATPSVQAPQS